LKYRKGNLEPLLLTGFPEATDSVTGRDASALFNRPNTQKSMRLASGDFMVCPGRK